MTSLKTTGPVDLSALDMSELSRAANGHHAKAESVVRAIGVSAFDHALSAGAALAEAKSRLKHGEWLPWLAQNFDGGSTTAQNYLRLFDRQGDLPNAQTSACFSIDRALKILSAPKPKPKPEPKTNDATDEATEPVVKPSKQKPGVIVSDLLRYLNDMHERWPEGESRRHLIACLRQAADRLEKIEAQNGGEQ